MPNITGGEILIILLVALIVLGPQRLPDAARTVWKAVRELRKVQTSVQTEIRSTIDEVTKPVTETAAAMQQNIEETTKEVSPGGPSIHVDPGSRAAPPGGREASPNGEETGEHAAGAPESTPPRTNASGTAVFTLRDEPAPTGRHDRETDPPTGPDRRRADEWGEAPLYDDTS